MKKLTALSLASLKVLGFTRDPETVGLYVQVTQKSDGGYARNWVYRYRSPVSKKDRYMGLGSCDCVAIHEARDLAKAARKLVTFGADPIDHRNATREQERQEVIKEKASTMTFSVL